MNRSTRNSHARIDDGPTTGPSRLMALVLMARDDESGLRYALPNGESVIGCRPDCDLVLDAPAIAPRHARIFRVDDRAVLRGLAAEYPVYVNGAAAGRHVLADGDEIQLAHYRLRFVAPGRPVCPAPPAEDADAPRPAPGASAGHALPAAADDHSAAASDAPGGAVATPSAADEDTVAVEAVWPDESGGPDARVLGGREPAVVVSEPAAAKREAARPAEPGDAPPEPTEDPGQGIAPAAHSDRPARDDPGAPPPVAWVWGSGLPSPPPAAGRDPDPEDASAPETGAASGVTGEVTEPASPPPAFHLDILSGINQGRRVTLTHERVVLGFDRERLVEIRRVGDDLCVRRIGDQADARLNGEPMGDASTTAAPGDVLSVQRIDMRVHRDTDRRG